jgi:drug/metabolite transporter (DMT)-like permease
MADPEHRSVAESVEGIDQADFRLLDWGQLALSAAIYGSAFLWIALALRSIHPGALAFGRVALGAIALAVVPAARCAIERQDWPRLIAGSFFGMAAPVFLFALAEERIPSAVAGMMVSAIPIMTAVVAAIETRSWPTRNRLIGLGVGLVGIVLLALPNLSGSGAEAIGIVMALGALFSYAIASTLYAPLQQTYGSLRVTWWLLIASVVMLFPLGVVGLPESSFEPLSFTALLILGIVGTGIVWALFVGLIGRVGAVRASIIGYLIPVVALVLGVLVLDEQVELIQVGGVAIALLGGYLVSLGAKRRAPAVSDERIRPPAEDFVEVPAGTPLEMCR